jgi:predicted amidohydrolase YtcJ
MVLDIYEKVLSEEPGSGLRHRIEHAQILSPEDIGRFAALGVIPSMQFIHCTSDMPWVPDRIGAGRVGGAYAWRSLMDAGSRIPGGSDYPVEPIDPLLGIYAAVSRQRLDGTPAGGWAPEQRLTIEEAVRAYTIDAAWASGMEDERGSIEKGKLADLTILGSDIMKADPGEIPGIAIIATVIAGKIEYRADGAPF